MYWEDGLNNYKTHSVIEKEYYKEYNLSIKGSIPNLVFKEYFLRQLDGNTLPINVMYSGGLDSEFVLCMIKEYNIPVTAITMKLLYKHIILNQQDVYYSEKFCRHNSIKQKFIELNLKTFYETNDYKKFITKYNIESAYLSSQFWLLSQVDGFNIIGGNYFWPQYEKPNPVLSPMSYGSNFHQKFMDDNGIKGIGNMLSHSYELNYILINEHKTHVVKNQEIDSKIIKKKVYDSLSNKNFELRFVSNGWENKDLFNIKSFDIPKTKFTICGINWDDNLKMLIESNTNSNYYR